jgi:nucleoid-associated protein YgaU
MDELLERMVAVIKAAMIEPLVEWRAYGDGVESYKALAQAIRTRADAGGYGSLVREGDNLTKIARRFYGDDSRWKDIFDANQDKIKDRNVIRAGQVLTIPPP